MINEPMSDMNDSILWDMTLAWNPDFRDDETLPRLRSLGYTVVGLTVGTDRSDNPMPAHESITQIEQLVASDDRFMIIRAVDDVSLAKATGKLGLELNFQGTRMLAGDLQSIAEFQARGVRHIGLIWNDANDAGASSTGGTDDGLTVYGKQLVHEMEKSGIIVDGSHAGYRTTMDAIAVSTKPFIISHTNCYAIAASYKNVRDDQIKACAETGGVLGVSGFGTYLGDLEATTEAMYRHIDHISQLVGAAHVGIGLDYVTKQDVFWEMVRAAPHIWPDPHGGAMKRCRFFNHDLTSDLIRVLVRNGYSEPDVRGIVGENWLRVAKTCWL